MTKNITKPFGFKSFKKYVYFIANFKDFINVFKIYVSNVLAIDNQLYSFNVLHGLHNDRLWLAYKVTFYSTLSGLASYNNE